MATWVEDVVTSLQNLGGVAPLSDIYTEVARIRTGPHPESLHATIRATIERNSSDSAIFAGQDLFFSDQGIGGGVWGLQSHQRDTPEAADLDKGESDGPTRTEQTIYRILRDSQLARRIKLLHNNHCQLCGETIRLPSGDNYSEAHHIRPLGAPHNGPDLAGNIITLCPNHHAMLDYGVLELRPDQIRTHKNHLIGTEYIAYHNREIWNI